MPDAGVERARALAIAGEYDDAELRITMAAIAVRIAMRLVSLVIGELRSLPTEDRTRL